MIVSGIILDNSTGEESVRKSLSSIENLFMIDIFTRDGDLPLKLKDKWCTKLHVMRLHSDFTMESEINRLTEFDQGDFIAVLESGYTLDHIKERIEYYYASGNKLSMIRPTDGLHGLVYHVKTFQWLCGFGEQTIMEKIEIQSVNDGLPNMVLTLEEFYEQTNCYAS